MTLTPSTAKSIVEQFSGISPHLSQKGPRQGQHVKYAYRFKYNGPETRHISISTRSIEGSVTVYVNKRSASNIVFPDVELRSTRVTKTYPRGYQGNTGDKGLSSAAAGLPTLDPKDNDVLRLSISSEDGFRRLLAWYFGEVVVAGVKEPTGSNIIASPTALKSLRDEQSEQPPDADIDFTDKLEYPLEDIQQRAIKTRRGQPDFRKRIFTAYDDKCAITGCGIQSVLEAAHIVPHANGTDWHISNGLPLRADIHTLFDLRLLAVAPDYRIHISGNLAGSEYEILHGQTINLPGNKLNYPSTEKLAKHFEGFNERNSNEE